MENSKFARKCKKDGGYFKCCGSYWWLDMFEEARNRLIEDNLIVANKSQICDSKSQKNPCLYCSMNGICTKTNPLTGGLTHDYYPSPIPEGKVHIFLSLVSAVKLILSQLCNAGKWDAPTIGLRFTWCLVLDLCKGWKIMN